MDAAHTVAHLGAELEELEADGCDGGVGELGVAQPDAAQGVDEDIGHGREGQAKLIGLQGGGGGAVGEQLELLADAVLGLAAGAIEILVEGAGIWARGVRLSEVTTKRGLAPSSVCSALPTTRAARLQLSSVR